MESIIQSSPQLCKGTRLLPAFHQFKETKNNILARARVIHFNCIEFLSIWNQWTLRECLTEECPCLHKNNTLSLLSRQSIPSLWNSFLTSSTQFLFFCAMLQSDPVGLSNNTICTYNGNIIIWFPCASGIGSGVQPSGPPASLKGWVGPQGNGIQQQDPNE